MGKLANYPYQTRMRQLSTLSIGVNSPAQRDYQSANFQLLATRIGVLIASGNTETRSAVASVIQGDMLPERHMGMRQATPQSTTIPLLSPRARKAPDDRPQNMENSAPELPRYTTALKEHGDRSGSIIEWTERQVSVSPLCWKALLTVDGVAFEATAGNKKEAKHRVSQSACRSLAIEV